MTATDVAGVVRAVAARPSLWPSAVRQARRLAVPGWWRRAPFAPVPDGGYRRFRSLTQYGDGARPLEPADVVRYLAWCRSWERIR